MDTEKENVLSPIAKGVKLIGIGKHGSKKLPNELIVDINEELKEGTAPAILMGAFFGALMMKDIEQDYFLLEEYLGKGSLTNASVLWDKLCADAPTNMKAIGVKLIDKKTLSVIEASELGAFLFGNEPGESFRGMAVSILRIRYESDEEYEGLYNSIQQTCSVSSPFIGQGGFTSPIIQLAEPFDGVEHSYMITPILANELQKLGYNVVIACGRNSGPKLTLNTLDIYQDLNADFLTTNTNALLLKPKYGFALDQKVFYPALDSWIDKRRIIMKRPFLATLEKVLNPVKANILITSVFHIPYLEKMVELGMMAGFDSVIVLKRGLEGTLAPSLTKATGILCAVKKTDGSIATQNFDSNTEEYLKYKTDADEVVENISSQKNVALINKYLSDGQTGYPDFDLRVAFAIDLYTCGLRWIAETKKN